MSTRSTVYPRCRYCGTVSYPFGSLCDDCADDEVSVSLGSCGCVEYHVADCPTRTGGSDSGMSKDDYLDLYSGNPDLFEDTWY